MELIITMAILSIISGSLLGNFISSQKKGRDAQRKSDLKQIQNALEAYYNDHGEYPDSASFNNTFGGEFHDENETSTVYMIKVPQDPKSNWNYFYSQELDGQGYYLYADLENNDDPERLGEFVDITCGASNLCDFGVSSPNLLLENEE